MANNSVINNNVNNEVISNGDFLIRNRMTAQALKEKTGSNIEFIANPKRQGHVFFSCGDKIPYGYISPKVMEKFESKTLTLEDMQFAECSKDGGKTWIPCLMMKAANNVAASF